MVTTEDMLPTVMNSGRRRRTPALTAAVAILRFLGDSPAGAAPLGAIHRELAMSRSSCFAALRQLDRLQMVARDEGGRYRLGPALIQLGQAAARGGGVLEAVRPVLWRLHQQTRLTAIVARRQGARIVVVDTFEPADEVHVRVPVGVPLHLTSGALGKCLLAFSPSSEVTQVLRAEGVRRFTERSHRTVAAYLEDLQRVRRRGFAVSFEEFAAGVHAVAAPVLGPDGAVTVVMALAGFSSVYTRERMRVEGPRLRAAAAAVSRGLPGASDGRLDRPGRNHQPVEGA